MCVFRPCAEAFTGLCDLVARRAALFVLNLFLVVSEIFLHSILHVPLPSPSLLAQHIEQNRSTCWRSENRPKNAKIEVILPSTPIWETPDDDWEVDEPWQSWLVFQCV